MKPTRRTFMQGVAGFFAGLFGSAEAAAEYVEWLQKPKKVMVPGVDFEHIRKPTREEVARIAGPYRTPADRYSPKRGALHQEVMLAAPGSWRTGDFMGREGVTYGKLLADEKIPIGCQLGPKAKLIHVDEARRTLKFELDPGDSGDWMRRYNLAVGEKPGSAYRGAIQEVRKIRPPLAVVVDDTEEFGRYVGEDKPPSLADKLVQDVLDDMARKTLEEYGD